MMIHFFCVISSCPHCLVEQIIADGRKQAKPVCPLYWSFNGTQYYGAAHGTCGILFHVLDALIALDEKRKHSKTAKKSILKMRKEEEGVGTGMGKETRASILADIETTIEYLNELFELHENLPTDAFKNSLTEQVCDLLSRIFYFFFFIYFMSFEWIICCLLACIFYLIIYYLILCCSQVRFSFVMAVLD
jgi:hypothetical protein